MVNIRDMNFNFKGKQTAVVFMSWLFHCIIVFHWSFREKFPLWVLESLGEVLCVSVAELKVGCELDVATAVTETFRALRNSCVGQPDIQKAVTGNSRAVDATCSILQTLCKQTSSPHCVACLRVGAQFLGNVVVNNKATQTVIWNKCSEVLV
jgi:hypothetical protein